MNGVQAAPAGVTRPLLIAAGALLILSACAPPPPQLENHPDWVIRSKISFVEADLVTPRQGLPVGGFRLSFPYVGGHLYGPPTMIDLLHAQINPDYSFVIDLNSTQAELAHSLPEFGEGQESSPLRIDPADARIARLMPEARKLDTTEQIATPRWVDARTHAPLMLVYFDRPARITGAIIRNGRTTRYNIRASQTGYVWIGYVLNEDNERMYREVAWPEHPILALARRTDNSEESQPDETPPPEEPATSASPASASPSAAPHSASAPPDLRGTESPRQAVARERGTPAR
jgi:hypothetical protein